MSQILSFVVGLVCNLAGLACIIWPSFPKSWGAWEFVGRLFRANNDPGMGIQYMFYWLYTIPLGFFIAYSGTYFATQSHSVSASLTLFLTIGSIYVMYNLYG